MSNITEILASFSLVIKKKVIQLYQFNYSHTHYLS